MGHGVVPSIRGEGWIGGQAEGWISDRIDDGDGVAGVPRAGSRPRTVPEASIEVVDPPADAHGPPSVVLVSQGVGQDLHRMGTGDQVPVAVEPRMDLHERELTVTLEDLQAGVAEAHSPERPSTAGRRRQGLGSDARRPAAALPGHGRPQVVTEVGQLVEEIEPVLRGLHHRVVEVVQLPRQGLSPEVRLHPLLRGDPGLDPVPERARITQVPRTTGDRRTSRRRLVAGRTTRPRVRRAHRKPQSRRQHQGRSTTVIHHREAP